MSNPATIVVKIKGHADQTWHSVPAETRNEFAADLHVRYAALLGAYRGSVRTDAGIFDRFDNGRIEVLNPL